MTVDHASLAGRVAVVTGAAGGIGSVICRRLAEKGASVAAAGHNENAAQGLALSLPAEGLKRHRAYWMDVTDAASLGSLAEQISADYGSIDILVNCVGITRFVPHADLDALDDELIDSIFRTNWRGSFATIRSLRPLLDKAARESLASGPGAPFSPLIVNISSVAATLGIGSNIAYCASKAAVNVMTLSLARALAPAIRVVSISPGVVETEFIQGLYAGWREEQLGRTPLGRLVSPDEVADAVLAAATMLRGSTGCVIPVDGGRPLG